MKPTLQRAKNKEEGGRNEERHENCDPRDGESENDNDKSWRMEMKPGMRI